MENITFQVKHYYNHEKKLKWEIEKLWIDHFYIFIEKNIFFQKNKEKTKN